jgi:hypothetical protein
MVDGKIITGVEKDRVLLKAAALKVIRAVPETPLVVDKQCAGLLARPALL